MAEFSGTAGTDRDVTRRDGAIPYMNESGVSHSFEFHRTKCRWSSLPVRPSGLRACNKKVAACQGD